jgi:hypothetical protein
MGGENASNNSAGAKPNGSYTSELPPLTRRSGVTNGQRMYLALRDRNSVFGRRLADLNALMLSDLGGHGLCSEAEKALVRRAAMLMLQLEIMEQRWVEKNGGEASEKSLMVYQGTVGGLRRVLRDLGLKRRARDVTPTLHELMHEERSDG